MWKLIRLRGRPATGFLYLARSVDDEVPGFPGSQRLLGWSGSVAAAASPALLAHQAQRLQQPPLAVDGCRTELVDLRRVDRAIHRDPRSWGGQVRGTIVSADDLLFDVAATVGDRFLAEQVSRGRLHDLYRFVWGEVSDVGDAPALWRELVGHVLSRLEVPTR